MLHVNCNGRSRISEKRNIIFLKLLSYKLKFYFLIDSAEKWAHITRHPHDNVPSAGTSAQQLDASFSTNASLEFFELDLSEPSLDMKSCGSFSSSHRSSELPTALLLLLTFSLERTCSSRALSPQIPQTGLGTLWNGYRQPPIWRPYCRRWERQRHPIRSSEDHGWRERCDHRWEWQAHGASESSWHQPISGLIYFIVKCNILYLQLFFGQM